MTRATAAARASDGRVHDLWWSYVESRVQVLLLALFSGSVDVVHECVTRVEVVRVVAFVAAHVPSRLARFRPGHVRLDGEGTYNRITTSLKNAIGFSASKVAAKERMRAKTGATVDDVASRLAKYASALDNRPARCRGATSASNCVTGSITPQLFVLELGKGTGPFERFLAKSRNDDVVVVVSVDNDARYRPDFQLDIFEWPHWIDDVIEKVRTRYPNFPGFFHYVHFRKHFTKTDKKLDESVPFDDATGLDDAKRAIRAASLGLYELRVRTLDEPMKMISLKFEDSQSDDAVALATGFRVLTCPPAPQPSPVQEGLHPSLPSFLRR